MLKYWSIENFKSFRGRTDIELASINVFAGANSSGKSTIIQSILLLKQTLQHAPPNRALALNGPILKLGTFEDVCNSDAENRSIAFAWAFDIEEPQPSFNRSLSNYNPRFSYYWGVSGHKLKSAAFQVRFDVEAKGLRGESQFTGGLHDEIRLLQPQLACSSIRISRQSDEGETTPEHLVISRVGNDPSDKPTESRLADFFISVALQGKQCVLETHSEYMIERFRRRIAEANGDDLTNVIKIYFTERVSGETKCRPIEVSRYGAIPDWPLDFFDQSQIETESILEAGRKKRALDMRK